MICPKCGAQSPAEARYCAQCGNSLVSAGGLAPPGGPDGPAGPAAPALPATSGKAIWSLVLGILSLFCFWIVTGIPAIVLGALGLRDIRRGYGRLRGEGMALAGIILGAVGGLLWIPILLAVAVPNFLEMRTRAKVARAKADLRAIAGGLDTYMTDHPINPARETENTRARVARARADLRSIASALEDYSADKNSYPAQLEALLEPVMYITNIPTDPFSSPAAAGAYRYYHDAEWEGWILYSAGPDGVYDLDPARDYSAQVLQPSPIVMGKTYDSTNGSKSRGDVWRVKQ